MPQRVRFPYSSLDGRQLPLQLSPRELKRLANLSAFATLPRYISKLLEFNYLTQLIIY